MKGKGIFWVIWIVFRGKSIRGPGYASPFEVISLLQINASITIVSGEIKLHLSIHGEWWYS